MSSLKQVISKDTLLLLSYVTLSSVIVLSIVVLQYFRYGMFGTRLLLGWDSPGYVWLATQTVREGPLYVIQAWSYPHFYVQVLAFTGYLVGDIMLMERFLPFFFGFVLMYANSRIVLRITKNVHVAGLAAILTAISLNFLRLFSDLHRNLMAFSLSFLAFLLIPDLYDDKRSLQRKKYLLLIIICFAIAGTQFETFVVFAVSLLLYGLLTRNLKKLLMLLLACTISVATLILLLPLYFFGYMDTVVFLPRQMFPLNEIIQWTGGSWLLFAFLVASVFFFWKFLPRNNDLIRLIFSWCSVIILFVVTIELCIIPFPNEFAVRALFNLPIPVLLALAVLAITSFVESSHLIQYHFFARCCSMQVNVRQLTTFLLVLFVISTSVVAVFQHYNSFLTPYISHSTYHKILLINRFLASYDSSSPVVIFYGDPAIWFTTLYRNYISVEIGEHFAYYGEINNLFRFVPLEKPKFSDPILSETERYFSMFYLNELIGNRSGPPPPQFYHDSYIASLEDLAFHPIVIVSPDFYNDRIPYCLKPFYISDGIYVIPPHSSIDFTEVFYGPEITVIRNGVSSNITSEYFHIDPYDPSLVYLKLNVSSGYQSYNLTNFRSNMTFAWMEQGNDLSYPEHNPMRLDGTKAVVDNDPTEFPQYWTTPITEQEASFQIDPFTRKEGNYSLKITGKTDSWSNLAARYDTLGTWNLARYSSIGVWVKCNESAPFSITLVDYYGGSRTFWAIETGSSSAATSWKRLVANLTEYTSQTPDFRIDSVDYIDLFVSSTVGKNMSFWIDDLTIDTPLNLNAYIYKDRVPTNEPLVIYFYSRVETSQTP